MAENLIINLDDVLALWPQLDYNTEEANANAYIKRSQQGDLKPLIGPALYHSVTSNPTDPDNVKLIQGDEYEYRGNTIFFEGIKPYLAAAVYSRMLNNLGTNAGRASIIEKQTEQATPLEIGLVKQRSREAESESLRLQSELMQYLQQHQSVYPLYGQREGNDQERRTSFRISKVPRHPQR